MTKWVGRAVAMVVCLCTGAALAQSKDVFQPFRLAGGWQFTSANTGTRYGGDVSVSVERVDEKGVMWGKVSYDGRQSIEKCGTRALFKDEPVDAEIVRVENGYQVTYQVRCASGQSPRTVSWTLSCSADGTCTRPQELPHGKGALTLHEQR